MKRNLFIYIASTLLVMFWLYAGLTKLADTPVFVLQQELLPLPEWSIPILKWSLPILALITGSLIYYKWTRLVGLILSTTLLLIYTIYVLVIASGALGEIPFSYGVGLYKHSWTGQLLFNSIFTIISWLGLYQHKQQCQYLIRHKVACRLRLIYSDRINRGATENRYKKTGFR